MSLASGNVPVDYRVVDGGFRGTDQTVALMSKLAMGIYGARSPKIRALAINILTQARVPEKDYTAEMVAIHNWVRDHIRYTRDVHGQETLSPPEEIAFNSRAGDCLDGDTRLLTPTGYKAIRDVREGDTVQGRHGWTKVTRWWDRGVLPTKEYALTNGGTFVATDDHKCFRQDGTECRAADLRDGDTLLGPSTVVPVGEGSLTEADCYFLGVYLADGWEDGNRICIAGKDGCVKEQQKLWVQGYAQAKGWITSWHPRYIRVYLPDSDPLSTLLRTGKLAPEKEIPAEVLAQLDSPKAERLLAGLLVDSHHPMESQRDLDAVENRKSMRRSGRCYSTTSEALAKQVRLLYRFAGVGCRITKVVDHGGLGSHAVYRLYPRHFRPKPAAVESISAAGNRHVYDIETSDHGIYLPDADVVVHNCDDKSMLVAALLGSIGIPTRFKVIGVTPHRYSHVYLQARPKGLWISLDPIMRDKPAGWEAPKSMRAVEKVYPENVPEGVTMKRGIQGLGYVGDPRIVSHLEEEPAPERPAGPYVQMNSFLDNDAPIEQLSNDPPAFPQNGNLPQRFQPRLQQRRPRLGRINASVAAEEAAQEGAVRAAMLPGVGMGEVWTPEQLAAISTPIQKARPAAHMQRPAMASTPEGIDLQFGRNALVLRGDRGDRVLYRGLYALNERPPVRPIPVQGVQGLDGVAPGTAGPRMLPGMGYLGGHSLSGPGMGELADVGEEAPAPTAPSGPSLKTLGLLAIAAGALLFLRKK